MALPDRTVRVALELTPGATLREALLQAQAALRGQIDIDALLESQATASGARAGALAAGVFGRLQPLHWLLRDGDRVEIYRPLAAEPKLARRRRVELARAAGRAGRAGGR